MIKVVLLDYGRVVAPEDGDPVVETVYGAHSDDHAAKELFGSIRHDLAKGLISEEDVYIQLQALGIAVAADYEQRWSINIDKHMYPTPDMTQLIIDMKKAGHVVMLLSNVWPLSAKLIRENGWYDAFDKLFLSCEMGTAKPEPAIYDAVLADVPFTPDQFVFVDDKRENLAYPAALGMATLHVDSPDDAVSKIREFLHLTASR